MRFDFEEGFHHRRIPGGGSQIDGSRALLIAASQVKGIRGSPLLRKSRVEVLLELHAEELGYVCEDTGWLASTIAPQNLCRFDRSLMQRDSR